MFVKCEVWGNHAEEAPVFQAPLGVPPRHSAQSRDRVNEDVCQQSSLQGAKCSFAPVSHQATNVTGVNQVARQFNGKVRLSLPADLSL